MSRWPALALFALATSPMLAQAPPAIDPDGLPGTRILGGGGALPNEVYQRFLELAGGPAGRIVLLPGASSQCDSPIEQQAILARWRKDHPGHSFTILHTRDRTEADRADFVAPLQQATGVWIGGGTQKRLADAYLGTRVEAELQALLRRGGVVGGTSAGTAIQTRTMIQEGREKPIVATGFDFVPFAVSDQHFLKRNRLPRLRQVLEAHAGLFGIGVDEGTAVEIRGRELRVHGVSKALLLLPAADGHQEQLVELGAGQSADLVTWQRAAVARSRGPWPPANPAQPRVPSGSLLLVGGGRLPDPVIDRFVALAGGRTARVVLVPSATPADQRHADPVEAALRERGAEVRIFDAEHPRDVTPERLAVLADATGVWFGGGRQWRLCDVFDGTAALTAFRGVLARGGVIGGSSAGATIQGEFLVRGSPLGNTEMWCQGYDRGFAFLPGCAVDQHFLVRQRTRDLQQLIHSAPQCIGIGIDEATAVVVTGDGLEVLGTSKVAIFDARRTTERSSPPEPVWLSPGDRWNLVAGERR